MRLLDRYQLREFLLLFGYCLAGILVFWLSFELLGELEEARRREAGFTDLLLYEIRRLPLHLMLQLPVALLLSLLYVLTQHARYNELIAMRAAGISVWRFSMPYLGVGVVLSVGMLAVNEYLAPDAASRAEAVWDRHLDPARQAARQWQNNLNFRDAATGRIWFVRGFNEATAELAGVHVQWPAPGGVREELMARQGRWSGSAWEFEGVTRLTFPPGAGSIGAEYLTNRWVAVGFPETPAHLRSEVKISRLLGSGKKSRQVQLSLREILTYRELHRQLTPQLHARLQTWFQDRIASPWTCLVVVLIAVPAGAGVGRRNVIAGVAATIFIAFAFFVVKEVSLAAGTAGYLAPWLAAWLPNLVFGGVGVLAIRRLP